MLSPPSSRLLSVPSAMMSSISACEIGCPVFSANAVMYLASAGEHFEGGEFAFIDETADRLVEARAGRLLLFDSEDDQRGALHNLHQVRPVVVEGQRLALSVWFTRGEGG